MKRRFSHLFVAVTLCAGPLAGCTTRLYPGPTRPSAEVSTVSFVRSHPNLSISGIRVDDISGSSSSLGFSDDFEILPGHHSVRFAFRIDADSYCDAREHLCPGEVLEGSCSGDFTAEAGQGYAIQLSDRRGEIDAIIRPARTWDNMSVGASDAVCNLSCTQSGGIGTVEASNESQF